MKALWTYRSRSSDLVGTVINIHNGEWVRRGKNNIFLYILLYYFTLSNTRQSNNICLAKNFLRTYVHLTYFHVITDSGVGAGIDSYYEYCLKAYILLGEEDYLQRFNQVNITCTEGKVYYNMVLVHTVEDMSSTHSDK